MMAAEKSKKNREKLKKELEILDSTMTLSRLVKKNDLEGVFLTNSAKESETISDDVSDRIINSLEKEGGKDESKGMSIINRFASETIEEDKTPTVQKRRAAQKRPSRPKKTKIKKARRR
jgi:hypothetical protein